MTRRCRCIQLAIFFGLVTYAVVGFATLLLPSKEIFPFYSWCLFALTPHKKTEYELRVQSVNRQTLNPAPPIQTNPPGIHHGASLRAYRLVQQLGAAYENSEVQTTSDLLRRLQLGHVRQPMQVALYRVSYDPIQKYRANHTSSEKFLTFFQLEPAP